jgi:Flp pilus assembly pilin Flp
MNSAIPKGPVIRTCVLQCGSGTCPFVPIADPHEPAADMLLFRHKPTSNERKEICMSSLLFQLWRDDVGQDIAEYSVMLAVILVIVVGTIRLVGTNANNVFSSVASSVQ